MAQDNPLTTLNNNDTKTRAIRNQPVGKFCATCPNKTENIIVIGSEHSYDSFWWKMMFITPAFSNARGTITPPRWGTADKTTILYVSDGYSHSELLPIEYLKDSFDINLKPISSNGELRSHLNTRDIDGERYNIQNLVFYGHGLYFGIKLNYQATNEILFDNDKVKIISPDIFSETGRIYSYACRTGVSVKGENFLFIHEAEPENSLAQAMANHFNVNVHAFLTRTLFRNCIRNPSDSDSIATNMQEKRVESEGEVISISDEHEGLPHAGQGTRHHISGYGKTDVPFVSTGQEKEGTSEYSLWRKSGALFLPVGGDTPAGLPNTMQIFNPE